MDFNNILAFNFIIKLIFVGTKLFKNLETIIQTYISLLFSKFNQFKTLKDDVVVVIIIN